MCLISLTMAILNKTRLLPWSFSETVRRVILTSLCSIGACKLICLLIRFGRAVLSQPDTSFYSSLTFPKVQLEKEIEQHPNDKVNT